MAGVKAGGVDIAMESDVDMAPSMGQVADMEAILAADTEIFAEVRQDRQCNYELRCH